MNDFELKNKYDQDNVLLTHVGPFHDDSRLRSALDLLTPK